MNTRALAVPAFVLAAVSSAAAATTWVVDAGGAGDFTQIHAALGVAQPGDVVLVMPGGYAAFSLDADVTIVGHHSGPPQIAGTVTVTSASGGTLAHLDVSRLEVTGVSGPLLLDDVDVSGGGFGLASCISTLVDSSADVRFDGCTLAGKDGDVTCEAPGLNVVDSHVTLTDCTLLGGDGWGDLFEAYAGRVGLDVSGDSLVRLSRTSVVGGDGGTPDVLISGTGGDGASAMRLVHPATAIVRGNSSDVLQGGLGGFGGFPGQDPFTAVYGDGSLVASGVVLDPPAVAQAIDLTVPAPAQPFAHLGGLAQPGGTLRLNVYGPAGATHWVAISLGLDQLALPLKVDGPVAVDVGALLVAFVPIQTVGHELSQNVLLPVPELPGLEGLLVAAQAFAPGLGLAAPWLALDPAHAVVR